MEIDNMNRNLRLLALASVLWPLASVSAQDRDRTSQDRDRSSQDRSTTDRDFSRFPGLRWRHPLEG